MAWPVHRLKDMIGSRDTHSTAFGFEGYFRAVPSPYRGGRIRAAWAVLTGKAYAVKWPEPGEFEDALGNPGINRSAHNMCKTNVPGYKV